VEGESSSGVEEAPDNTADVAASVPTMSTAQPTSNGAAATHVATPAAAAVERTEPTEHELYWTQKFLGTCRIKENFSCGKCKYCTGDGAAERKEKYIPAVVIGGVSCIVISESTKKAAGVFRCTLCCTTGSAATNGVNNIFGHTEKKDHFKRAEEKAGVVFASDKDVKVAWEARLADVGIKSKAAKRAASPLPDGGTKQTKTVHGDKTYSGHHLTGGINYFAKAPQNSF